MYDAEDERVLEGGRQVGGGHALDHADEERGEQRAQDAAEAAEGHDGVGEDGEGEPRLRVHGEEVGEDDAGDRHQRRAQAPGHRVHALGADAHEHGGLAVLGCRLERQAEVRAVDQEVEEQEQGQRDEAADEQRHADANAADA